jgi:hypothetical protein
MRKHASEAVSTGNSARFKRRKQGSDAIRTYLDEGTPQIRFSSVCMDSEGVKWASMQEAATL